jgi:SAM-dependent methyltransferase
LAKYKIYQDYVIRDGRLVGEFEEMYRDFDDPWEQSTREKSRTEKLISIFLCKKYGFSNILEMGCGLGHFSNEILEHGINVTGVDISQTAISKASETYPKCSFICGDVLDFEIYERTRPDCIIFSEVTWYILEKLDTFLSWYNKASRVNFRPYLLHLLTLYPDGVQQYGREFFTDLQGILKYFRLSYEEYGQITSKDLSWCSRSYFLGRAKIEVTST